MPPDCGRSRASTPFDRQPISKPAQAAGTRTIGAANANPGRSRGSLATQAAVPGRAGDQKVTLQVSMRPVSCAALSLTRSYQVPLSGSLDRFTV